RPRVLVSGINWSPTPRSPFPRLDWTLRNNWICEDDPCVLAVHLACPRPEFTDTGKTVLNLPSEVELALRTAIDHVAKDWREKCQKAKRERDQQRRLEEREIAELLREEKAGFLSIKDACIQVMEQAYMQASGNGKWPAYARQVMYAARRFILQQN